MLQDSVHTVVSWLNPLTTAARQQLISAARTGDAQSYFLEDGRKGLGHKGLKQRQLSVLWGL